MPRNPAEYSVALWEKARNDLIAARAIMETDSAFDTVAFHARQAVEKSLKSIIARFDENDPKTHDLRVLIGTAKPLLASWPFGDEQIVTLAPYAVTIRYDEMNDPVRDEVAEALAIAEDVHSRVGLRLREFLPPQASRENRK